MKKIALHSIKWVAITLLGWHKPTKGKTMICKSILAIASSLMFVVNCGSLTSDQKQSTIKTAGLPERVKSFDVREDGSFKITCKDNGTEIATYEEVFDKKAVNLCLRNRVLKSDCTIRGGAGGVFISTAYYEFLSTPILFPVYGVSREAIAETCEIYGLRIFPNIFSGPWVISEPQIVLRNLDDNVYLSADCTMKQFYYDENETEFYKGQKTLNPVSGVSLENLYYKCESLAEQDESEFYKVAFINNVKLSVR